MSKYEEQNQSSQNKQSSEMLQELDKYQLEYKENKKSLYSGKITVTKKLKEAKLPDESDFREWVMNGYLFVDKSLFIKEIIESTKHAILMTAPRRFGKSINMSMLKYFLEIEVNQENGKIRSGINLDNHAIFKGSEKYKALKIGKGHIDAKKILEVLLKDKEVEFNSRSDVNNFVDVIQDTDYIEWIKIKDSILNKRKNDIDYDIEELNILEVINKKHHDGLKKKFSKLTNKQESGLQGTDQKSVMEEAREKIKKIESEIKSKEDELMLLDNEKKEYIQLKTEIESLEKSKEDEFDKLKVEVQKVIDGLDKSKEEYKEIELGYGLVGRNLGKHPVIFLTLGNIARINGKDNPNATKDSIIEEIRKEISKAYKKHGYLYRNMLLEEIDDYNESLEEKEKIKVDVKKIKKLEKKMDRINPSNELKKLKEYYNGEKCIDLKDSLYFLSELLYQHFGKKAYILVDEYDRPSNCLLGKLLAIDKDTDEYNKRKEEHDEISSEITSMLCEVGKINTEYTKKVIMTGIMDVLKRDSGSGFNNVAAYGILDKKYSEYFGIIEDGEHHKGELQEYLKQIGFSKDEIAQGGELRKWLKNNYNGYNIPSLCNVAIKVYNPYSLINCLQSQFIDEAQKLDIGSKIEFKEAPSDWVNSGEIINSIGFKAMSIELMQKFQDLINSEDGEILLPYKKYIDIGIEIDINQESKLASILINYGYLTLKEVGKDNVFKFPNREVKQYFAENYYAYWVADRFDGYSATKFIEGYIKNINNGQQIEILLNDILRKSRASTKNDTERDFQCLLDGAAKIYDIFSLNKSCLVLSEYKSFNGNKIDCLIAPCDGKGKIVIHEYKKTNEDKDKPVLVKLRESISQPFEQGYLISAFNEIKGLRSENITGYANYLGDHQADWEEIIVRGLAFSYQGDLQNYNKSDWKVLVKEVILDSNEAENIVKKTCSFKIKAKKSEKSSDRKSNKNDGIERIKKMSTLFLNNESSDIYEIFQNNDKSYSSLSKEKEFIDSFVEYGISDDILGQTSYKAKQMLKEKMIKGSFDTQFDFEDALNSLQYDTGEIIFKEKIGKIASAWINYRKDSEIKKKLHNITQFLRKKEDILSNEESYSKSNSNINTSSDRKNYDNSSIGNELSTFKFNGNNLTKEAQDTIKFDYDNNIQKYKNKESIKARLERLKKKSDTKHFKGLGNKALDRLAEQLSDKLSNNQPKDLIPIKSKPKKGYIRDNLNEGEEDEITYKSEELETVLKKRLINENIKNVAVLPTYKSYEEYGQTTESYKMLSEKINQILKGNDIALLPYAEEDHYIGIIFKKDYDNIAISYMDSDSMNEIDYPSFIKFREGFESYLIEQQLIISSKKIEVSQQKYLFNCGIETVENFIGYLKGEDLTNRNISQDKAIGIHKVLRESNTLSNPFEREDSIETLENTMSMFKRLGIEKPKKRTWKEFKEMNGIKKDDSPYMMKRLLKKNIS